MKLTGLPLGFGISVGGHALIAGLLSLMLVDGRRAPDDGSEAATADRMLVIVAAPESAVSDGASREFGTRIGEAVPREPLAGIVDASSPAARVSAPAPSVSPPPLRAPLATPSPAAIAAVASGGGGVTSAPPVQAATGEPVVAVSESPRVDLRVPASASSLGPMTSAESSPSQLAARALASTETRGAQVVSSVQRTLSGAGSAPEAGTAAGSRAGPRYRESPEPAYPSLARRLRQEGLVRLTARVGVQGQAVSVALRQTSGFRLLDEAALQAVRGWRFEPARIGSMAVESEIDVPLRFRLTR